MFKITIKGKAHTSYEFLQNLNGIDCQEEFSEYFQSEYKDKINEQTLINKNVCNGYMHFEYSEGNLWTVTTYDSPVELTQQELEILSEYTQGQWSDGIGENFEQEYCYYDDNNEGVYISPCSDNQELIVRQFEIAEPFDWDRIKKRNKIIKTKLKNSKN